jgi:hypothetical protein
MKKNIFYVFLATVLFVVINTLSLLKIKEVQIRPIKEKSMTLTDYYKQDLYAQCNGLESFKKLIEEHPSLVINKNFNQDYQNIIDKIEIDKKMLNLDYFKCP